MGLELIHEIWGRILIDGEKRETILCKGNSMDKALERGINWL